MHVGERICFWRFAAGLTMADLADGIGVSKQALQQWEAGDTDPTMAHIEMAITSIGIARAEFWGDPGDQRSAS